MWFSIVGNLLPYAIDIIVKYIKSNDSSKDDKVLEVIKIGAKYLSSKDNNDISKKDCSKMNAKKMLRIIK